MTKARKVDILYRMAKGQRTDASSEELMELRKYKICAGDDANCATRANITNYVAAVDNGYRLSFYDWCANNLQGDRRKKSGRTASIARANKEQSFGSVFVGWLVWGLALYWIFDGAISAAVCAIMGAVVAFVLQRCSRRLAGFTLIILPIILAVIFALYI